MASTRSPDPTSTSSWVSGIAAIAALFETMPDIRYELVHSSFGLDLVVLELVVTGTPADGRIARLHACDVMTLRDGKVAAKRSCRKVVE
jgi:hypothetical protein